MEVVAFLAAGAVGVLLAKARSDNPAARSGKDPESGVDRDLLGTIAKYRHRFGFAIRPEFGLDWRYTHLNHGSYGCAPHRVMRAARHEMEVIEAYPDDFFRRRALGRYIGVCDAVGDFLGAPKGSVVLVNNATDAVNTVLRAVSRGWKAGNVVLVNNHTYAACRNAVLDTAERCGAEVACAQLPLPVSTPAGLTSPLLEEVGRIKAAGKRLVLVLLDHITSPTALVLPIAAMTAGIKAAFPDCVVLVDGAHAPGMLPLKLGPKAASSDSSASADGGDSSNVEGAAAQPSSSSSTSSCGTGSDAIVDPSDLSQVDFYCGNLHKWCFTVKGCAFLYTTPARQEATQGTSVSHFWKQPYQHRFYMQGTGDFSRYLSIPAALSFMTDTPLGGIKAMREYNSALVKAGGQLCAAAWGTETLLPPGAHPDLCAPFMLPVRMPFDVRKFLLCDGAAGLSDAAAADAADGDDGLNERVSNAIYVRTNVQAQTVWWRSGAVPGGCGALFIRLSAQVYNTLDDYRRLAAAVTALAREVDPLAWKPEGSSRA